jgi:catalase (peroxidase I)
MSSSDDFNIQDTLLNLSANFEQPDKFAEIFCNAAKKQKSIDSTLKDIVRELLKHDKDTVDHLKSVQRQVNKEDLKNLARQIGATGWSVIMLVLGGIISLLLKKYFG